MTCVRFFSGDAEGADESNLNVLPVGIDVGVIVLRLVVAYKISDQSDPTDCDWGNGNDQA